MLPQVGEHVHVVQVAVDGVKVLQEDKNTERIQLMLLSATFQTFSFLFCGSYCFIFSHVQSNASTDIILYKKNDDAFYNESEEQSHLIGTDTTDPISEPLNAASYLLLLQIIYINTQLCRICK